MVADSTSQSHFYLTKKLGMDLIVSWGKAVDLFIGRAISIGTDVAVDFSGLSL